MKTFKKPKNMKETLLTLTCGETMDFPYKEVKPSYVRLLISRLRNEGFDFLATEAGLIDSIRVTRIK